MNRRCLTGSSLPDISKMLEIQCTSSTQPIAKAINIKVKKRKIKTEGTSPSGKKPKRIRPSAKKNSSEIYR